MLDSSHGRIERADFYVTQTHDGRRFGTTPVNEIVCSSLKNQWPRNYSLTRQLAVESRARDGNPGRFLVRLRSMAVSEAVRVSDYMEDT